MVAEQDKALEAVQVAIQMEIDGKEYYLAASQRSGNQLGKDLFRKLAGEEDYHRRKFVEIYDTIRVREGWPVIILPPDRIARVRTVFADGIKQLNAQTSVLETELAAVEKAMEMENKTYDYYQSQAVKSDFDAARDFYRVVAAEEREHHRVLQDYFEFLKDPAAYFVAKEHPSLDGG